MIRFLADMGVSQTTVHYLKNRGFDVTHLRDEGLQRASDAMIMKKAREEDRTILTFDLDFGAILASSKDSKPSVIIFRLDNCLPTDVNDLLSRIIHQIENPVSSGAIVLIEQDRFRIRHLPIK
jgi:predicted nuclease of predicted toxin-antitoxin system